ncbi:MAG: hypothetical protein HYS19_02365 [Nitrosomonadales bacterium]|nr:hypothetical protein [Nitrosomonadales bacterium]
MLRDYFFRFALVVIFCLPMIRPASAEIEQVLPESNARLVYYVFAYQATTERATPDLSRMAFNDTYGGDPFVAWGAPVAYSSCGDIVTTYSRKIWNAGWTVWKNVLPNCLNPVGEIVCPSASPAYAFNATSGMCEREAVPPPTCAAAGTVHSEGFYDIGTSPTNNGGIPPRLACDNGCQTNYEGDSVGWRVQVGGVYHYFAQGAFVHQGVVCASGEPSLGVLTSVPTVSCAAGQSLVTGSNGFKKCYDDMSGSFVDGNSASSVAAAATLAAAKQAAAINAAYAAAQAAGLSASGVEASQSVAAGVISAGGFSGVGGSSSDPVMSSFCQDNPTASVCAEQEFGKIEDSALGEKTINVSITPVTVGGAGSCPAPTPFQLHDGVTRYFQWTTYCNYAIGIKPILLAFAWLSAAGLLVGGFRSA